MDDFTTFEIFHDVEKYEEAILREHPKWTDRIGKLSHRESKMHWCTAKDKILFYIAKDVSADMLLQEITMSKSTCRMLSRLYEKNKDLE